LMEAELVPFKREGARAEWGLEETGAAIRKKTSSKVVMEMP
jgi:hypothetical protein